MAAIGRPDSTGRPFESGKIPDEELAEARSAYHQAITDPEGHHAEVGILRRDGTAVQAHLGKNEEYGVHRVGSVTKTFTTFLALKLTTNERILPHGLQTQCKELFSEKILAKTFENSEAAGEMTLEQLLSHTAGLEYDDHSQPQKTEFATLHDRFMHEGRKYFHTSLPGDGIGNYSNAGVAVAGWMMEVAYNNFSGTALSFAEIMKQEIFEGVFGLSDSFVAPGPSGDIIQSPAGDMSSSVQELLTVGEQLQQGETSLEHAFGTGWQQVMLRPRDLFEHHGLGCAGNAPSIEHAGLNREKFGAEERDVTALVVFPLKPEEPGLVAMCDSNALGPHPAGQRLINALKKSGGIARDEFVEPTYELDFFCPTTEEARVFHGNAYLVTDVDPFAAEPPEKIIVSRNGMKHVLTKEPSLDGENRNGYLDENARPWVVISQEDGRKMIYSDSCLVRGVEGPPPVQPDQTAVQQLVGTYQNAENPEEHPTYIFTERGGHLYLKEGVDAKSFPCLFLPGEKGGTWVGSNPSGRDIQFRFPANPNEEFLVITDILRDMPQLPDKCRRI